MIKTYSVEGLAEAINLPIGTVRKYQQEIGYSKIGRRLVFREEDVEKFLERHHHKPVSELVEEGGE